jgi:putative intracellular protease/amidase
MEHAHHAREHAMDGKPSLNHTAWSATLHCLTGCAIGEVLGMVIGTALGWGNGATIALAVVLAFAFGFGLTLLPLLRAMGFVLALKLALAADAASITAMEIVDNAVMLIIPGAMDAGLDTVLFWSSLAFSLAVAAIAAFPLNRWLIARGKGHAVVHAHHHHALAVLALSAFLALPVPSHAGDARVIEPDSALPRYKARFSRPRAVVAVVGYNAATEVTDYVVPYGILAESGVAEVVALATGEGAIQMSPALRFQAQATTKQFDARFPQGADYVIVPNVYDGESDVGLLDWIRSQAARGAIIVGICDGVPTVANAGLLKGRRATGHWRTIDGLERRHPGTQWLRNTRYVADGNVITTSGVSASIPVSVALVEAIGGRAQADKVARFLGIKDWSPVHNSEQFKLEAGSVLTVLTNKALFWRHEALGLEVDHGVDEISVALIADAYARTRRSSALAVARSGQPVLTRRGLLLIPDTVSNGPDRPNRMLPLFEGLPPAQALDRALEDISRSYGPATADFVALTMEYPYKTTRPR